MKNYVDDNYKKSFAVTKKRYGGGNASAVKKLHKTAMEVEAESNILEALKIMPPSNMLPTFLISA